MLQHSPIRLIGESCGYSSSDRRLIHFSANRGPVCSIRMRPPQAFASRQPGISAPVPPRPCSATSPERVRCQIQQRRPSLSTVKATVLAMVDELVDCAASRREHRWTSPAPCSADSYPHRVPCSTQQSSRERIRWAGNRMRRAGQQRCKRRKSSHRPSDHAFEVRNSNLYE